MIDREGRAEVWGQKDSGIREKNSATAKEMAKKGLK